MAKNDKKDSREEHVEGDLTVSEKSSPEGQAKPSDASPWGVQPSGGSSTPPTDEPTAPADDTGTPGTAAEAKSFQEQQAQEGLSDEEQFELQRRTDAQAQNLTAENAVPEQRPQAFTESDPTPSALTQRLIEEGAIPDPEAPPMGFEAYQAASDTSRMEQTAGEGVQEAPHIGTRIFIDSGPHRGRQAAVLRIVSYPDHESRLIKQAGDSRSDYVVPKEIEVSFQGDERDGERAVLNLDDIEYRVGFDQFSGRALARGSSA